MAESLASRAVYDSYVPLVEEAAAPISLPRSAADFNIFPDKSKQPQRNFTRAEVARCDGEDGHLYVIFNRNVLDLTDFVKYHYGGSELLRQYGGQDATAAMIESGMPPAVFDILPRFCVGRLIC